MKKMAFVFVFLSACASSQQSTGPNVQVAVTQQGVSPNIYYFRGPVSLQYELMVSNPTNQPITLTRLDLASEGPGAYSIHTTGPFNLRVPPNSTASRSISAWGYSRGGFMAQGEPVSLRVTAVFTDANRKTFQRFAMENLTQP